MRRHGLKTEELTLSYYPSNLSHPILGGHGSSLRTGLQGGKVEKVFQDENVDRSFHRVPSPWMRKR